MKSVTPKIVFIAFVAALLTAVIFIGCDNALSAPGATGTLKLELTIDHARTIEPTIDMTEASFVINGEGPQGRTFSVSVTDTIVTVPDLVVGTWYITIFALNSNGDSIYTGESSVEVMPGTSVPVSVALAPLAGNGTLNVNVNWNPGTQVAIIAELIPFAGASYLNLFPDTSDAGTGTYQNATLEAGYYTLIVKIDVGGKVYGGSAEIVRIVAGAETNADFTFDVSGDLSFIVNIKPNRPLDISLNGQADTVMVNTSMNMTATVPLNAGNVAFVWYLDGMMIGTGAAITIDASAPGLHVLSVTGFSADGLRAGSVTHEFTVLYPPGMLDPMFPLYYSRMESADDIADPDIRGFYPPTTEYSINIGDGSWGRENYLPGTDGNYYEKELHAIINAFNFESVEWTTATSTRDIHPYGTNPKNWNSGSFEARFNLNTYTNYDPEFQEAWEDCPVDANIYFISEDITGPLCVRASNSNSGSVFVNVYVNGSNMKSINVGNRNTWKMLHVSWNRDSSKIIISVDGEETEITATLPDLSDHVFATKIYNYGIGVSVFRFITGYYTKRGHSYASLDEYKVWDNTYPLNVN